MPTLKVPVADFSISSSWKAKSSTVYIGTQSYGYKKWVFESGPTQGTARVPFNFTLPSGAKVNKAVIWAKFGNPLSGCSARCVNSKSFTEVRGEEYGAVLDNPSASFEALFVFKANGTLTDDKQHYSTLTFSNVYLELEYEMTVAAPTDNNTGGKPTNEDILVVPPQSVCIYDETDGSIYFFDGVIKITHTLAMDIQEEPDAQKKNKYVNNAKNEPDKLTLDIVMSDVYSGNGPIVDNSGSFTDKQRAAYNATENSLMKRNTQEPWTRSENAFHTLHWLKEERRKLAVITPQYVHTDMIISSFTCVQDENSPFGWEGQLVFQQAYAKEPAKPKKTRGDNTGNENGDPSLLAGLIKGEQADKMQQAITGLPKLVKSFFGG